MQDFDFILDHCNRIIELYQRLEKDLINNDLSSSGAKWVQEELQMIKSLIQNYQESEFEKIAKYFNQD